MTKQFTRYPCSICGKMISNCGFAYTKHEEAHARRNELSPDQKRNLDMRLRMAGRMANRLVPPLRFRKHK